MNLISLFRESLSRVFERKKTLIAFVVLFFFVMLLGIVFIKTPAIYDYHLNLCDRFVNRVCYANKNVLEIFLERAFGHAVLLVVICFSGIHVIGLIFPPIVLAYRAYTFGGSLYIFFTVYRFSGALIVFVLYLPIHLLIDAVLLCSTAQAYGRGRCFEFCRRDWLSLLSDLLVLFILIAAICLLEMILLLALFHPIGNIT